MWERFSKVGEHGAVWYAIGLAGAALDEPRRGDWLRGVRRVALSYGVNQLIKVVVRRERPPEPRVHTMSNLSFPSAHTTTSFCGARTYTRLGLPWPAAYGLAAAVAASRLALRVHHPSDVAAGAALGTVLAR